MIMKSVTIQKGPIRSCKLKKERHDNDQWKKDKDLENKTNNIQHYVQDRITPVTVIV